MTGERIYHYAPIDTLRCLLEGIEKSDQKNSLLFQASNIFFMNDPQEFIYGQDVLLGVLEHIESKWFPDFPYPLSDYLKGHKKNGTNGIEERYKELINKIHEENKSPYVISFTRQKDSLPMWLNYGDGGKGVCLAFSEYQYELKESINLEKIDDIQINTFDRMNVYDVHYHTSGLIDSKDTLYDKIEQWYKTEYCDRIQSIDPIQIASLQEAFHEALTVLVTPFVKRKEYEHEKEVRMSVNLFYDYKNDLSKLKFRRNGKRHIIPYIEVEIPKKKLEYVMIGPLADKDLSTKVIEMMKKKYELSFDIKKSDIKYRDY